MDRTIAFKDKIEEQQLAERAEHKYDSDACTANRIDAKIEYVSKLMVI